MATRFRVTIGDDGRAGLLPAGGILRSSASLIEFWVPATAGIARSAHWLYRHGS